MTAAPAPVRIQRRRIKGWKMPAGTIYCGRPGGLSNPWRVVDERRLGNGWVVLGPPGRRWYCSSERVARRFAVWRFRRWARSELGRASLDRAGLGRLRTHNGSCWCGPDQPCHVDVLLELANLTEEQ